jgi:hypothetical protein
LESLESVLDVVIDELETELADQHDPLMALAGCVGTVLLHWESLDGSSRRELIARVDKTVRALEFQARLAVAS